MNRSKGPDTPRSNKTMNLFDELRMSEEELDCEDDAQFSPRTSAETNGNNDNNEEQQNLQVLEDLEIGVNAEDIIALQREVESSRKFPPRTTPERHSASATRFLENNNSRHTWEKAGSAISNRHAPTAEEPLAMIRESTENPYSIDKDPEVKSLEAKAYSLQENYNDLINRIRLAEAEVEAEVEDVHMLSILEEERSRYTPPPGSQVKEEKIRPKRPTYDKMMPGGIPDWARSEFLYQNETKRTQELIVRVQLMRSQMALTQGDYEESMEYAIKAGDETRSSLKYQPLLARCAAWRGKAELKAGLFHQAVESLEEAMYCKGKYFEGEWVERELMKARLCVPETPKGGFGGLGPKPKSRWRSSVFAAKKGKEPVKVNSIVDEPRVEVQEEHKSEVSYSDTQSETESETLESDSEDDGWYQGKMKLPVSSDHEEENLEGLSAFPPGPTINPFTGANSGLSGHKRKQSGSIPSFLNLKSRQSISNSFTEGDVLMEVNTASDGEITAKPTLNKVEEATPS